MKTITIGDSVRYIRHGKDGVTEGEGIVKGIVLDPEGRILCHIKDGENVVSAYATAINLPPACAQAFRDGVAEIERVAAEGNDKVRKIVAQYNHQVDSLREQLFGPKLEL